MGAAAAHLAGNIARVHERIAAAAASAGRAPESVTLVAVSKTQPAETVAAAARLGLRHFGENRLEEAVPKMQAVPEELAWHMVGHIQSRKAGDAAAAGFALLHSVDSLKLARRLSAAAEAAHRRQDVLLECNVSGEASKAGLAAAEPGAWPALVPVAAQIAALPGLRVRGLMTMAPLVTTPDQARPFFSRLRALRDELARQVAEAAWAELSMGMTGDFEAAIAEGATLVRVGRAIFGERG